MEELNFEWDPNKAKSNASKHGVSFDQARTAFYDENAIIFADPDHSADEDRYLLVGNSFSLGTLVVCHCFRKSESVIRLISARKADKDEIEAYWRRQI